MFDRRSLLKLGAGTLAATLLPDLRGQQASSRFGFSDRVLTSVPHDFNGLSYESPQLANPAFFAASNTALVTLFRELAPTGGVLRLGGNLSAFTTWRDDPTVPLSDAERSMSQRGKKYWEWDLTDPSIRNGNRETVFHPGCIQALSSFLEATGWRLIYGLNFAQGTPQQAAAEAACVQKFVGKRLLAFQLGNEDDFWRGGFRSNDWEFPEYLNQWKEWSSAIRQSAPDAPFAGPDIAVRLDWVEKLAAAERNGLAFASGHHYAMGPAGDPRMTAEHLLDSDPEIAKELAAAQRTGVPFRNTECNSCFHGGQKGVSDSYASALWAASYMLTLAQGGHAGVNLHGGGNGIYSPIVGDSGNGFLRRPLYFGMQFAQAFCGAEMLEGTLLGASSSVVAFAGRKDKQLLVGLINKGGTDAAIEIALPKFAAEKKLNEVWTLSGPALNSSDGVTFARLSDHAKLRKQSPTLVPAYSGMLLKYS